MILDYGYFAVIPVLQTIILGCATIVLYDCRYMLHDVECVKMLRTLQSSHELVQEAIAEMDRDQTGTIEYAEFLGFGPRMTNKPNRCHTKKVKHTTP